MQKESTLQGKRTSPIVTNLGLHSKNNPLSAVLKTDKGTKVCGCVCVGLYCKHKLSIYYVLRLSQTSQKVIKQQYNY